jgi:hypothetical protein
MSAVSGVAFFPERLKLHTANELGALRFADVAGWHRGSWLCRPFARRWGWVLGYPYVADRDWFDPPPERYFRFYTAPSLTLCMPDESSELDYDQTTFRRVQKVIAAGGFSSYDLARISHQPSAATANQPHGFDPSSRSRQNW